MQPSDADVVVVGAGLAGLVAAHEVERAGLSAVVVEARDRVGGRLLSRDAGSSGALDLGGAWLGPTQDRALALAAELGVRTFPQPTAGANLLELGGRLRRYTGTVPSAGPHVLLDAAQARLRIDRLARRVDPESPWRSPRAQDLDGQTFETWLRRNVPTRAARRMITVAGKTVWGAEPREMSLLDVLAYVRAAGGLDPLFDVEGGAQQDRLEGGAQLLALRLAERLAEPPRLGAPVRRIAHTDDGVRVDTDAGAVAGRRAIVAVPPPLAGRIDYAPALPARRTGVTERMPPGALMKCLAVYPEPFWRDDGLTGEAVSDLGPATLTFDVSPPDGRPGVLLGFVGGDEARALAPVPAADRRGAVLAGFMRLFGARAGRPDEYLEQDWTAEPWSGGGPTCVMVPGGWTGYGSALRAPVGVLHWAGTETAARWRGYMDGAVRSGERTAAEVVRAIGA